MGLCIVEENNIIWCNPVGRQSVYSCAEQLYFTVRHKVIKWCEMQEQFTYREQCWIFYIKKRKRKQKQRPVDICYSPLQEYVRVKEVCPHICWTGGLGWCLLGSFSGESRGPYKRPFGPSTIKMKTFNFIAGKWSDLFLLCPNYGPASLEGPWSTTKTGKKCLWIWMV